MARCRCSNETCVCVVEEGEGISVTGTGSPSSPWVISTDRVITGTLAVADTNTVDMMLQGQGTLAEPYVISAAALFAISGMLRFNPTDEVEFSTVGDGTFSDPLNVIASLPWVQPIGGEPGDVLTQQADGTYAAGPPALVPAGTIITGPGLAGDGTPATPMRVDVCTYADLKALCVP